MSNREHAEQGACNDCTTAQTGDERDDYRRRP